MILDEKEMRPKNALYIIKLWQLFSHTNTIFDDQHKYNVNTDAIMKQGQQRIHILHKLNALSISPVIFCCF